VEIKSQEVLIIEFSPSPCYIAFLTYK